MAVVEIEVRVLRDQKVRIIDSVNVVIAVDEEDAGDAQRLAIDLIKAMDAAGQDINWLGIKETPETYPNPLFSTELISEE